MVNAGTFRVPPAQISLFLQKEFRAEPLGFDGTRLSSFIRNAGTVTSPRAEIRPLFMGLRHQA